VCVAEKDNCVLHFLELHAEKAARDLHVTAEISLSAVRCSKELGVDRLIHGTPAKEKLTSIAATTAYTLLPQVKFVVHFLYLFTFLL
jgi:hypothetical protein